MNSGNSTHYSPQFDKSEENESYFIGRTVTKDEYDERDERQEYIRYAYEL